MPGKWLIAKTLYFQNIWCPYEVIELFFHRALFLLIISFNALASDQTFIHKPYWEYNEAGLKEYAKEIVKTITPYFIKKEQIGASGKLIKIDNEFYSCTKR